MMLYRFSDVADFAIDDFGDGRAAWRAAMIFRYRGEMARYAVYFLTLLF